MYLNKWIPLSLFITFQWVNPAFAELTEAERAAISERQLTDAEWERKQQLCRLPRQTSIAPLKNDAVFAASFERSTILQLVTFEFDDDGELRRDTAFAYPYLPNGGIGARDHCAQVTMIPLSKDDKKVVVGLWLTSGLDLEKHYPAAAAAIEQNNQLTSWPSAFFLPIKSEADTFPDALKEWKSAITVKTIVGEKVSAASLAKTEGYVLWMRGHFFVPLKQPE